MSSRRRSCLNIITNNTTCFFYSVIYVKCQQIWLIRGEYRTNPTHQQDLIQEPIPMLGPFSTESSSLHRQEYTKEESKRSRWHQNKYAIPQKGYIKISMTPFPPSPPKKEQSIGRVSNALLQGSGVQYVKVSGSHSLFLSMPYFGYWQSENY